MRIAIFSTNTQTCVTYARATEIPSVPSGQIAVEVPEYNDEDALEHFTSLYDELVPQ